MTDSISRITVRKANVIVSENGTTTIIGYVVDFEPEAPAKRDVLRPVAPDEPDTEVEVGYSQNALEPLTIEFCGRSIELTVSTYRLFRYVNDLYRAEGQTEFEFAEISEVLTGRESGKSKTAIGKLIRQIVSATVHHRTKGNGDFVPQSNVALRTGRECFAI